MKCYLLSLVRLVLQRRNLQAIKAPIRARPNVIPRPRSRPIARDVAFEGAVEGVGVEVGLVMQVITYGGYRYDRR